MLHIDVRDFLSTISDAGALQALEAGHAVIVPAVHHVLRVGGVRRGGGRRRQRRRAEVGVPRRRGSCRRHVTAVRGGEGAVRIGRRRQCRRSRRGRRGRGAGGGRRRRR